MVILEERLELSLLLRILKVLLLLHLVKKGLVKLILILLLDI